MRGATREHHIVNTMVSVMVWAQLLNHCSSWVQRGFFRQLVTCGALKLARSEFAIAAQLSASSVQNLIERHPNG